MDSTKKDVPISKDWLAWYLSPPENWNLTASMKMKFLRSTKFYRNVPRSLFRSGEIIPGLFYFQRLFFGGRFSYRLFNGFAQQ